MAGSLGHGGDVEIEGRPRAAQIILFLLLLSALILEGMDVKLLAFAAPLILDEWGVSKVAFAPALAAVTIGMAVGAGLGGYLGDRIGRRPTILASAFLFSLTTFAVGHAPDITWVTSLRLVSGFGFGAILPNAYALMVEWLPQRLRAAALSVLTVATPVGGALGAGVVIWLLPAYGWRGTFMVFGLISCLVALAMLRWLPESFGYLMRTGEVERASREWRRVTATELPDMAAPVVAEPKAKPRASYRSLFSLPWIRLVFGSSILFFSGQFLNYAFGAWLPVMMTMSGLHISEALTAAMIYNCCAIAGGLLAVNVAPLRGSRPILLVTGGLLLLLLTIVPLLLQAAADRPAALSGLYVAIGLIGGGTGGICALITAVVNAAFPVELRSTGVGFGVMWGRIGAIVTIFAGGFMLDAATEGPAPLFLILVLSTIVGLGGTVLIDRHIQRRRRPGVDG